MKLRFTCILGIAYFVFFFTSCKKDPINGVSSEDSIYIVVDEIMNSWYYWYDQVPEVDIFQYNNPTELLNDLIYRPLDRWSFVDDTAAINSLFQEGENFGFGFMARFDAQNDLHIAYVYKNSPAYHAGIRKGNIITAVNGVAVEDINDFDPIFDNSPQTMQFNIIDNDQAAHQLSLSKVTFIQNSVFVYKIFDQINGKKVGYISYQDFLGYGQHELEEAFTYFKSNNIDELIVDLRYNSGGYISLAAQMSSIIVPVSAIGHEFLTYSHNDLIAPYKDTTYNFSANDLNLNLSKVFFITTKFTASASELVINCLDPYMEVYLIGSTTHGKPVGMYGFIFHEWLIYPITVTLRNADGYGDFFNGLPVHVSVDEGLDKDWGDETDPNIAQALYYIQYGYFNKEIKSGLDNEELEYRNKHSYMKRPLLLLDR